MIKDKRIWLLIVLFVLIVFGLKYYNGGNSGFDLLSGVTELAPDVEEGPTFGGRKVCGNAGVGGYGVRGHGCKTSTIGSYACYSDGTSCKCVRGPDGNARWRSISCQSGQVCKGGRPDDGGGCHDCPDGGHGCNNQCKDLERDTENCGSCGNSCSSGEKCFGSFAQCNTCEGMFGILEHQENPDCAICASVGEQCGGCQQYEGFVRDSCEASIGPGGKCDRLCWS